VTNSRGPIEKEIAMDEETLNTSMRKFLKLVGVSSQREIEQAVATAMQQNAIAGNETLQVSMTLEVPGLALRSRFDGELKLQ
jgi:hypothetical protein